MVEAVLKRGLRGDCLEFGQRERLSCPGVGFLGCRVTPCIKFWGTAILFSRKAAPSHIPLSKSHMCLRPHQHLLSS